MSNPLKITVVLSIAIFAVVGVSLLYRPPGGSACKGAAGKTYVVTIEHDAVSHDPINGHICDKIMITNEDRLTREIAFGPHDDHVPYDGVAEKFLNRAQSFTITLNQLGSYHWHDHLHDNVEGYFKVSK